MKSYSYRIKQSLCAQDTQACCANAELYGFLLFCNTFRPDAIKIVTEHADIMQRYEKMIAGIIGKQNYTLTEAADGAKNFILRVQGTQNISRIVRYIGNYKITPPLRIDFSVTEKECCMKSFLRGVFIAGGFISQPGRAYHLEIRTPHILLAEDLVRYCSEFGINLRTITRSGKKIAYLKSGEPIKDFLTVIGATDFVFDFANVEIERELRNNINRAINCESANLDKNIAASMAQIKAINALMKKGALDENRQLLDLARARLDHPEMTLVQLGQAMEPPLTKSGVAHRMRKIMQLAKE